MVRVMVTLGVRVSVSVRIIVMDDVRFRVSKLLGSDKG